MTRVRKENDLLQNLKFFECVVKLIRYRSPSRIKHYRVLLLFKNYVVNKNSFAVRPGLISRRYFLREVYLATGPEIWAIDDIFEIMIFRAGG